MHLYEGTCAKTMRYRQPLLLLFLGSLAITGCSSNRAEKPQIPDKPAAELLQDAQTALAKTNYETAAELLEALDTRYPFGPYSQQAQLDLIYAFYKEHNTAKALANIDRFIRNNPTHPSLDYVHYMRGLTNMAADYNFFQQLVGMKRYDRDPEFARQAFNDFNTLLKRYPNSQYAADAHQRLVSLKNNLALYELSVARYYIKREAYIAAINRARYIVENFSDTPQATMALEVMEEGYQSLELTDLQQQAQTVLDFNQG